GYLASLGGSQVYSATATVYLGQPYTPQGGALVQDPQTNPSAVGTVIQSQSVVNAVASRCGAKASEFKNGISSQAVATGASTKTGAQINPLVKVSVQTKKGKLAACAANGLAQEVVKHLGAYPARKIANLSAIIAFDNQDIKTIQAAIANPGIPATDKLI